jgi:hypothetical protein
MVCCSTLEIEPDALASCAATEAATRDIIQVLTSHNSRLRPRFDRFDVAISFRPCSDIEFEMQPRRVQSCHSCLQRPSSSHTYPENQDTECSLNDAHARNETIRDSTATICEWRSHGRSPTQIGSQHRPCNIPPPARPCNSPGHISIAGCSASSFHSTQSDSDASRVIRPRQRLWKRLLGCLGTSRAALD